MKDSFEIVITCKLNPVVENNKVISVSLIDYDTKFQLKYPLVVDDLSITEQVNLYKMGIGEITKKINEISEDM